MRVSCGKCGHRFDIAHAAVLAESRRLKEAAGKPVDPGEAGNVLDPADTAAKERRAEALRRRGLPG